ncbi:MULTISPECIES: glycoside hydrolase family protein [Pseudomonas]|uniref:glycoside hydrolase family protein n=1 Tax=Pseudomonas TaxID=286 RepID=UPI0007613838|nr:MULTISPECIES: hypothetical protein [Pseudomonas]MDG9809515.1 hypothetical protein [Pseudomonas juntendi]MDG9815761.1 hypothetical protein [Pseudomonas putida]
MASKKPTQREAEASIRRVASKKGVSVLVLAIALGASVKEGISLVVYDDGLGIPTTCFGQTGKDVKFGQAPRDLDGCSDQLLTRTQASIDHLDKRIGPIKTPGGVITFSQLTYGEQKAYVSIYDNVGDGRYGVKDGLFAQKSADRVSRIVQHLRAGDRRAACKSILDWVNPKWMPGIKIRREAENKMCLSEQEVLL